MALSGNLLLVSNDARLTRSLAEQLRLTEGLAVAVAPSADSALTRPAEDDPDLWLIDGDMTDMPAPTLVQSLRSRHVTAPVILLGGMGEPAEESADGSPLADDWVPRPWRLRFLLERIACHLAISEESSRQQIRIGPFHLRPAEKLLVDPADERRIRLTEKEVEILEFLADAPEAVSREALLDKVWGYQAGVTSHTLETHVYRLRQKIEADPSNAAILVNEAGGYRLAS